MNNPDRLRPGIEDFIDKTFLTNAILMYAPSQIALAAVLHAASKEQENLDSYVTESLFGAAEDKLPVLIEAVKRIRSMVRTIELPQKDKVRQLEKKLEKCRNQENNPDSQMFVRVFCLSTRFDKVALFHFSYKQRMKKMYEDEDEAELMATSYHMNASDVSLEVSHLNSSNPANMSIE